MSKCLTLSPLDLTIWNYRMKIVLNNLSEDLIAKETEFVAMAMGINAKVYAMWEYNKFLVRQKIKLGILDMAYEQQFIDSILRRDCRNFHCWNYRRWLAMETEHTITLPDDLENTEWLIEQNFSNYSALYHRYLYLKERGS